MPALFSSGSFARLGLAGLLALALFATSGCAKLPLRPDLPVERALAPAPGPLATRLQPMVEAHPGVSGFVMLSQGGDAFAARAWLVEQAVSSLDVQSYIWRDDRTGRWLMQRLHAAAERGVRVRLLLDDNNAGGLDTLLAGLDAHERIEVRLFNPFPHRGLGRLWDLAVDFDRLNRRMHHKSWTADGQATIFGGRNVGDSYFGVDTSMQFADLDALAVGPVVGEVGRMFDDYWNAASAYPLATVRPPATAGDAEPDNEAAAAQVGPYVEALWARPGLDRWRGDEGPKADEFAWGRAVLVSDPPGKVLETGRADATVLPHLMRALGRADRQIDLVSPYFVPGGQGVAVLENLREQGVKVRVLTNSLAANDVIAVHAGYAKYREAVLQTGTGLYELKAARPQGDQAATGQVLGLGSSRASLHAKTFAVDGERVFIGSFNFDPRSAWLNTEMGVLLEHPGLASGMHKAFDERVPKQAWAVTWEDDALRWSIPTDDGGLDVRRTEPEASLWQRLLVRLLGWLPIEPLL